LDNIRKEETHLGTSFLGAQQCAAAYPKECILPVKVIALKISKYSSANESKNADIAGSRASGG
jgi:hypothetical protein